MRDHGVTQLAMAKLFGVSHPTVHGWLNGARPRPKRLCEIARFFDASIESLLDDNCQICKADGSFDTFCVDDTARLTQRITPNLIKSILAYGEIANSPRAVQIAKDLALLRLELESVSNSLSTSKK